MGRLGLDLVLPAVRTRGQDRPADRLGADGAVVAQDLDLARTLDRPHPIDEGRHVTDLERRKLTAQVRDPMCIFAEVRAADVDEALGQAGGVFAAVDVRFVGRSQTHPESRIRRQRQSGNHAGEFLERPDGREAPRFACLRVLQPVLPQCANVTGALPGQVQGRRPRRGVQDHGRVEVLVAGEVEEVVVLTKTNARLRLRASEQNDRARPQFFGQGLPPRDELGRRVPHPFGGRRERDHYQHDRGRRPAQHLRLHGSSFSSSHRRRPVRRFVDDDGKYTPQSDRIRSCEPPEC